VTAFSPERLLRPLPLSLLSIKYQSVHLQGLNYSTNVSSHRVAFTVAQCRGLASGVDCRRGRRRTTASLCPARNGTKRCRRPCSRREGCTRRRNRPARLARSTWMRPSSLEPSTTNSHAVRTSRRLLYDSFLDPEHGSQKATLVVLLVAGISSPRSKNP